MSKINKKANQIIDKLPFKKMTGDHIFVILIVVILYLTK